ncbi:MAG: 30S ribosomal protein S27e [Halobacteriales archaeon]
MPSRILEIECPDCGASRPVFERLATEVRCPDCDAVIASPTGGMAETHGDVTEVIEDRGR